MKPRSLKTSQSKKLRVIIWANFGFTRSWSLPERIRKIFGGRKFVQFVPFERFYIALGQSAVAKGTLFAVQPKRESLQYWVILSMSAIGGWVPYGKSSMNGMDVDPWEPNRTIGSSTIYHIKPQCQAGEASLLVVWWQGYIILDHPHLCCLHAIVAVACL